MNVTTAGVKGYEYQYSVTVLIALLELPKNAQIFVEAQGSEDIKVQTISNNVIKTIEIQVKREQNDIDIKKLVNWLCHFQERSGDNNLLSRVLDNTDALALFVTLSRCKDEVLCCKKNMEYDITQTISLKQAQLDEFKNALNNNDFSKKTTKLNKDRDVFCKKIALNLDLQKLTNALSKVSIWEELTDEKLFVEISRRLNQVYHIPQSLTNTVRLELIEAVTQGRDLQLDIIPKIKKIIKEYQSEKPALYKNYQTRTEELELSSYLETNNLLLLTGISFCGKTEIAKKIATSFYEKGFHYFISENWSEVKRFLQQNANEDKIAILQDPFGHLSAIEESIQIWDSVGAFAKEMEKNHKLIITSRLEIINQIKPNQSIEKCKIDNHKWFNLTIENAATLKNLWVTLSKEKNLSTSIVENISDNLEQVSINEYLLQVGQLKRLADINISELENKNYTELEHLARQNSEAIAEELIQKDKELAEFISVLALCCNTISSVNIEDISYIYSNDNQEYSFNEKEIGFSMLSMKENTYPQYNATFVSNNTEVENYLNELEHKGFINIESNVIRFSHPNYFEVGRYLFFKKKTLEMNTFLTKAKKCLACLNPLAIYSTLKSLDFLYSQLEKEQHKTQIANLILDVAEQSIFPIAKDNSLVFLMKVLESFTDEKQEIILGLLNGEIHTSDIRWHNNIPYIRSNVGSYDSDDLSFFFNQTETELSLINSINCKLNNHQFVNSKETWEYTTYWQHNLKTLPNAQIIQNLLLSNEVFIRSKIAFLIASRSENINQLNILDKLFKDEHPFVIFQSLRGCFFGWLKYSIELKNSIFPTMQKALQTKSVVIRANSFMNTFGAGYADENIDWYAIEPALKKELWYLWGKLYPVFLQNFPTQVDFGNKGRFGGTMNEATKILDIHDTMAILNVWYDYLNTKLQTKYNHQLSDYELAVVDYLMDITGKNSSLRKELFTKLCTHTNTNLLVYSLYLVTSYWGNLSDEEKKLIVSLLYSTRSDLEIIRATLLNCSCFPSEIACVILGEATVIQQSAEHILKQIPTTLLDVSLNIYLGHSEWKGVGCFQNKKFWNKIIQFIILNNYKSHNSNLLYYFIVNYINQDNSFFESSEEAVNFWKSLCNSELQDKSILLEMLIYAIGTSSCVPLRTKQFLDIMIDSWNENDTQFLDTLSKNIEALHHRSKNYVIQFFDTAFLLKKIYPLLRADNAIFDTIKILEKINNIPIPVGFDKVIEIFLKDALETPIRCVGTFNMIRNMLPELNISDEAKKLFENLPDNIAENGQKQLEILKKKLALLGISDYLL